MQLPTSDLQHVVEHAGNVWHSLDGASIFLTGASGFIGRWLAESLTHAIDSTGSRTSVTLLTRNPDALRQTAPHLANHPAVTLLGGDMTSFAFPNRPCTHIVHAAIDHRGPGENVTAQALYDRNVAGTQRVLDFAIASGAKRFLYLSSGAVYGSQPPNILTIPETYIGTLDPLSESTWYAHAKLRSEQLGIACSSATQIEFVIARGFAFVGPLLPFDLNFAAGNFLRDALAGGPITIGGDGTPYRSYLYAADLAIWLWTLLVSGHDAQIYNVGSPDSLSIRTLAELVRDIVCPAADVRVLTQSAPDAMPSRYVPSTTRAQVELGLRPLIDLPDALKRTADWTRAAQSA